MILDYGRSRTDDGAPTVTPDRSRIVADILRGALACEVEVRQEYLANACKGDEALRAEVEALLLAHHESGAVADLPASPTSPRAFDAGTPLGPYRIESFVGAGSVGEVYRATDTRLGRMVAIRILPPRLRASHEGQARFEREARIIAGRPHPHICAIYDIGHEGDVDFLVMEYLEGETLATRLGRAPMALGASLALGIEIADALDHAHLHGVVHRDVRPANVMLTAQGAKLLEYGIAHVRAIARSARTGTPPATAGPLAGRALYLAPEQALGLAATPRSDLFALGVVLFQCLTSELPFDGDTFDDYIQARVTGRMRSLDVLAPSAPGTVRAIVQSCLAAAPSSRPASAGAVRDELRRARDNPQEPGGADRDSRRNGSRVTGT
jgi:eukaryotic-like serine/threonine-protein kinase